MKKKKNKTKKKTFGDSRHTVNKDRFQFQFDFSQLKTGNSKKLKKLFQKNQFLP